MVVTRDDWIAAVRAMAAEGIVVKRNDFEARYPLSSGKIRKLFGSHGEFLAAAGLPQSPATRHRAPDGPGDALEVTWDLEGWDDLPDTSPDLGKRLAETPVPPPMESGHHRIPRPDELRALRKEAAHDEPPPPAPKKPQGPVEGVDYRPAKPTPSLVRIIIPDSHGNHIDLAARRACIEDIKALNPDEIIFLGDHIDAAGTFSAHQRTYTNEMAETFEEDVSAANEFLTLVQTAAPRANNLAYIEGNHEQHVERWAARTFYNRRDADILLEKYGPAAQLELKRRGISYHKRSEHYDGISIPGCIKRGLCYFVHGISHSRYATAQHLARFGANVVHGHTHRCQAVIERSVSSDGYGAWCPGTLAKLQPLYKHTEPSSWSHGFAVQFVNASGRFLHVNVPIHKGVSLLLDVARRVA